MNTTLYADAKKVEESEHTYPMMTGHAAFTVPYIRGLALHMLEPNLNPRILADVIRVVADEWTFIHAYVNAKRHYRMIRDQHPEWYS